MKKIAVVSLFLSVAPISVAKQADKMIPADQHTAKLKQTICAYITSPKCVEAAKKSKQPSMSSREKCHEEFSGIESAAKSVPESWSRKCLSQIATADPSQCIDSVKDLLTACLADNAGAVPSTDAVNGWHYVSIRKKGDRCSPAPSPPAEFNAFGGEKIEKIQPEMKRYFLPPCSTGNIAAVPGVTFSVCARYRPEYRTIAGAQPVMMQEFAFAKGMAFCSSAKRKLDSMQPAEVFADGMPEAGLTVLATHMTFEIMSSDKSSAGKPGKFEKKHACIKKELKAEQKTKRLSVGPKLATILAGRCP